jgi:hypothetical protein
VWKALAEADWFTADRARAWRNVLLVLSLGLIVSWPLLSRSGVDPLGRAIGSDFLSFYAASKLVLAGHAAEVYDVHAHRLAEISVFGRDLGYAAYFYPPLFLLICTPLALAPYLGALLIWLAATCAAFLATLRAWMGPRLGLLTALAFPAVLFNAAHGQNAFLTAALIGAAALWLDRRPWLAGVALGLLAFKPHLGLAAPLVLLAAGRWRTIVAAGATVAGFAAASVAAFGLQTWSAFLATAALARATLEQGLVEPGKMISAFAAARVLGAPTPVAYAAQAVSFVAILGMLLRPSSVRGPTAGPLFVLAALLASPFLLDYDLVMLAFPLAWLARRGLAHGFLRWEKALLLVGFVLPIIARPLAMSLHLPIAPVVLFALSVAVARRGQALALRPAAPANAPAATPAPALSA